jgi:hypothetical protein
MKSWWRIEISFEVDVSVIIRHVYASVYSNWHGNWYVGMVICMVSGMVTGLLTDMVTQISFGWGIQQRGSTIGIDLQAQIFLCSFQNLCTGINC